MLRDRFSPQQIAGNLRRMFPKLKDAYVSHETIYNAIYALPVGELRKELIHCLRHGKTPLAGRVQAVLTVATRSLTWSAFTCVRPKQKKGVAIYFCDPHSPGSAVATKTLMASSDSIYPKAPIYRSIARRSWMTLRFR